jgi:hypothetical protein
MSIQSTCRGAAIDILAPDGTAKYSGVACRPFSNDAAETNPADRYAQTVHYTFYTTTAIPLATGQDRVQWPAEGKVLRIAGIRVQYGPYRYTAIDCREDFQ